jgi:pentose-5-phosphate-3-epimerase
MTAMTWRQWIRTVEIVPALGSADPASIELQVDALLRTGCRVFHLRAGEDLDAGGITHESVRELYDAGARVMVVGAAIFEREDLPRPYRRLVQALA